MHFFLYTVAMKNLLWTLFSITGEVTGFPDGTKFILEDLISSTVLDSAVVKDNSFELNGKLSSTPNQLFLRTVVNKKLICAYLLIGNEKIKLKGNTLDFPFNIFVEGSKYNYHKIGIIETQ